MDSSANKMEEKEESFPRKQGVKKFLKHVMLAAKRSEERKKAKDSLDKEVSKLKRMVVKKAEQDAIEKSLKRLDEKLNTVLHKEGKILVHDVKGGVLSQEIRLKILDLENRLNELGEYDIQIIDTLKDNISTLKNQLYEAETLNQKKIEFLNVSMNGINAKLDTFIQAKEERDQRMQELEEKIKKQSIVNADEIKSIEMQIAVFEAKFDKFVEEGNHDESMLAGIKKRIDSLKQKLFMKKAGMSDDQEKFLKGAPTRKSNLPPPPPIKKEAVVNPDIKHDMHEAPPIEMSKPGELPPLPPLPPMPSGLKKQI